VKRTFVPVYSALPIHVGTPTGVRR